MKSKLRLSPDYDIQSIMGFLSGIALETTHSEFFKRISLVSTCHLKKAIPIIEQESIPIIEQESIP